MSATSDNKFRVSAGGGGGGQRRIADFMCSILTHPAVPIALSFLLPKEAVSAKLLLIGAACSIIPDLDVIGFRFGIRYSDMLGHRGFTHSFLFAALLALLLVAAFFRDHAGGFWMIFLFLFASTLSHTLLDMLTNGGLGVALFAPFSNERYFFPWTPIEVSPIGIGNFFSRRGAEVIISELKWVWLPSGVVSILGYMARRFG
jgi:inner membrane protein